MYSRMRRVTILSVILLVLAPVAWWVGQMGTRPKLWADDELEERDCRRCGGEGVDDDPTFREIPMFDGKCPFCRGTGRVEVIIPGESRPTKVKVLVVDGRQVGPYVTYSALRKGNGFGVPQRDPTRPFEKVAGAIGGAVLRLSRLVDGDFVSDRELESNPHGLQTVLLEPGVWRLRVQAPGFRALEGDVEVPVLTEPIWLEKAKMVEPPRCEAEARSLHGIEILAVLSRTPDGHERFEVRPGEP